LLSFNFSLIFSMYVSLFMITVFPPLSADATIMLLLRFISFNNLLSFCVILLVNGFFHVVVNSLISAIQRVSRPLVPNKVIFLCLLLLQLCLVKKV
jgi:hypothetical protein